MRKIRFQALLLALALAPLGAAAQNLVTNGGFDVVTAGWTPLGTYPSAQWSPLDAAGKPNSGSLFLSNGGAHSAEVTQCILVAGGRSFRYGATIRVPSGQQQAGWGEVDVSWFPNTTCAGNATFTSTSSRATTFDTWTALSGWETPGATTQSALVELVTHLTDAGHGIFEVFFDDVWFVATVPVTLTIPTSASIHGNAGAFFHSDLWAMNRSFTNIQTVTARYHCFAGQSCGSDTKSFALAPRQSILYSDVVGTFFASPETAGAIELTYDSTAGQLSAGSRVYTPSIPSPTSGTAIPALPSGEARARALFLGLGSNAGNLASGFRSNAGVYNPNAAGASVTFTLYNGATGAVIGSPLTRTWGAQEAYQINDIFAAVGAASAVTTNAYLVVTSTAPVFPFVTVIDNQSGDSIFVPASADEAP